ncbi:MAG TPA: hypothetical protein ENF76_03515 [Candidatus Bathyarchaeota archaeon]|nr:hypothetical protein [Candidatus Bathyarchaeota archaeon]
MRVGATAAFAAFHAALFLPEGPWRSWAIYLTPIEAVILGPKAGFTAALIGSLLGRLVKPGFFWMFGIVAEPLSVLVCALLIKQRWKVALAIYGGMLSAYFLHPYGRMLPLWTILDLLAGLALIFPASHVGSWVLSDDLAKVSVSTVLLAFTCTATDSLTRVFLLVPAGLHAFFGWSFETLCYAVFIPGAIASYIEDLTVVVVSFIVLIPLIVSLKRITAIQYPIS